MRKSLRTQTLQTAVSATPVRIVAGRPWQLLFSWRVVDTLRADGAVEIGTWRGVCRYCDGPFEITARVHRNGRNASRTLRGTKNCPQHRGQRGVRSSDELAHELGVADLFGCECIRCKVQEHRRIGLDLV